MDAVIRLIALIFAIGTIIMLFAAVFSPKKGLHEKGVSPSGYAMIFAAVFGVSSVICYYISESMGVT